MRILQINKFFSVHGGSETVLFETINGLTEHGDKVIEFSMRSKQNMPSKYDHYFVSQVSLHKNALKTLGRIFYSPEVAIRLGHLIDETKPEVAHVHNAYRELSATTFLTLRKKKIPTVLTVHDMFPLVPNHNFMRGETAAEAYYKNHLNWIFGKSINGSFLQSVVGALEAYYYQLRGIWESIDRFVVPSEFMKQKMIEYGFSENKIRVLANPCSLPSRVPPLGTKIVYFGRLHVEKGIRVFMRSLLEPGLEHYRFVIAGEGPERKWVEQFITEHNLSNVELSGFTPHDQISELMATAKLVVVPSVFYETGGLSAIEALSYGRLVIGSNRGALPEVIRDNETGFLVEPENPAVLAEKIKYAMTLPAEDVERITKAGRDLIQANHNPMLYIEKLVDVYQEIVK